MRILNQTVETVPLDALRNHPRNPRRGDVKSIQASIDNNGFYGAVIAQRSTGYIIAGNHRWLAAQESNATEIPVIWVDIEDDHALRIMLADNRTNDLAEYDDALLSELLNDLAESTGTLLGTGYDENAVDTMLKELSEATTEPPEDFKEYGEDIQTEHECPKCGYRFS